MIAVLILITCIARAISDQCLCGVESPKRRIIGGQFVEVNKHPWMAFVLVNTSSGTYQCGGAIISDRSILTSAHCLHEAISADVSVGSIYDASVNNVVEVQHATIHGRYNFETHKHDITILHLKEPLKFSESIRPICLPEPGMTTNGSLTVAGWGITETGEPSNKLIETTVDEYSYDDCNKEWNGTLTAWQFCAMSEGKDTCAGDGGGPAIRRWRGKNYVIGVISHGDIHCKGTRKSLYTKVSSYMKWIKRHTEKDTFCE